MAISGSTNYAITRDDFIKSSLRLIGVGRRGESVDDSDIQDAVEVLQMMIKAYSKKGLKVWQRRTTSLTLVASQASYTLGPTGNLVIGRPIDIIHINRRTISTGTDVPLLKWTQDEYLRQTPKTQTGIPLGFWYDYQLTNGVLYLWQVPDATAVSTYNLQITYLDPIDDMDSGTDDFEFPQEWYEALRYNLAYRMAPEYDVDPVERSQLRKDAEKFLMEAEDGDVEMGSIYIAPDNNR